MWPRQVPEMYSSSGMGSDKATTFRWILDGHVHGSPAIFR
jgi:hypothetical protein